MLAIIILVVGITARFYTPIPNFTPLIALALFGGVYLKKSHALLLPLFLLAITDVFLGAHKTMLFTWVAFLCISAVGLSVRDQKSSLKIASTSILSAIFFFCLSNLGVWLATGMYPMTLDGLRSCFIMAIPFFRSTLISTVVFTFAFFGIYEFIALRVKNTQLAKALL